MHLKRSRVNSWGFISLLVCLYVYLLGYYESGLSSQLTFPLSSSKSLHQKLK